jgi:hypothetical protein
MREKCSLQIQKICRFRAGLKWDALMVLFALALVALVAADRLA